MARSDPRRAVLIGTGALVAAAALLFLGLAVSGQGRFDPESSPLRPDDAVFDVGNAEARAQAIDRDSTPLLFQDPARGVRPVWVQHLGDDPGQGWVAFDAVVEGDCLVEWNRPEQRFVDCEGRTYPPDGSGLGRYPAEVVDGNVEVSLDPDRRPRPTTTTTTILITGD